MAFGPGRGERHHQRRRLSRELLDRLEFEPLGLGPLGEISVVQQRGEGVAPCLGHHHEAPRRSEEHTSELQSLMRISYAVFCLKKKKHNCRSIRDTHYRHTRCLLITINT